ncbi:MAG TPA: hypothetical protein VFG86_18465, partial [Chloroflexota bacterium]|nr:hypothetical protein [Chloroflexota bacterium]
MRLARAEVHQVGAGGAQALCFVDHSERGRDLNALDALAESDWGGGCCCRHGLPARMRDEFIFCAGRGLAARAAVTRAGAPRLSPASS